MATLTVHVVNDDDEPIAGANVFLNIEHNFMPNTHLEETTDDDGEGEFDFDEFCSVDISVNGNQEESDVSIGDSDVSIGDSDKHITICI